MALPYFALLNLSKAFDKVDHRILLEKVSNDLPRGFTSWLHSYLSGRSFQVRIQGELSNTYRLCSGVPQGSVLGPALFSILVGDLPNGNSENTFIQYADDLNIVCPLTSDDPAYIKEKVLNQLVKVSSWCNTNLQELNVEKSKFLLCTRQSVRIDGPLPIKRVASLTVLGVRINQQLSWGDHVKMICSRACQRLHVLRKAKPFLSQEELHGIYLAIIRSLFDYCCPVFIYLSKNLCDDIRRVERRAHKLIHGKEIRCLCNLDGLATRRQLLSLKLFTEILRNKRHLLHCRTPTTLPHSSRLSNFSCRTNIRQHSFFPYATLLSNNSVLQNT